MSQPRALLAASAAVLLAATSAFATPYTDVQSPNAYISPAFLGIFGGSSYAGVFNLVSPGNSTVDLSAWGAGSVSDEGGYTVGANITDATASFYFADDTDSATEKVNVFIGFFDGAWNQPLVNGGKTTVSFGGSSLSLMILKTFGAIEYVVTSAGGDFKLKHAVLTVNTGASVPDGGTTAILLGLGLLGVVAFRRLRAPAC